MPTVYEQIEIGQYWYNAIDLEGDTHEFECSTVEDARYNCDEVF